MIITLVAARTTQSTSISEIEHNIFCGNCSNVWYAQGEKKQFLEICENKYSNGKTPFTKFIYLLLIYLLYFSMLTSPTCYTDFLQGIAKNWQFKIYLFGSHMKIEFVLFFFISLLCIWQSLFAFRCTCTNFGGTTAQCCCCCCCLSIAWLNKQSQKRTDGRTDGKFDQWTDDAVNDAFPLRTKMYFIFERAEKLKQRGKATARRVRLSCNSKLICIANWRAIKQLQFMCITISERVSVFPLYFLLVFVFLFPRQWGSYAEFIKVNWNY